MQSIKISRSYGYLNEEFTIAPAKMIQLTELSIEEEQIDKVNLGHFSNAISKLGKLKALDISGIDISEYDIDKLAKAIEQY